MNRRAFLGGLSATVPLAAYGLDRSGEPSMSASATTAATPSVSVSALSGPVASRYHLTLDRVLHGTEPAYTPGFLLEDIHATGKRRFTNFSGDVSGRWIGALAASSRVFGGNFPVLDDVVAQVIALQKSDGYFGKTFRYENQDDDDLALLWGNGRLLVGLMEYYALKPKPEVLAAATKLGGFLLRIAPDFNTQKKADEFGAAHFGSSYICWTQQTEGLAALFAVTKDPRLHQLCTDIAKRIERRPSDHVHGYLCSLRGLVHMYEATGDQALLAKAQAEWQSVMRSGDVLVTGGVPERWSPLRNRTEGCAECDWMRLGFDLHRATGNEMYLAAAERVFFNEFSMNQLATGDFGHGELDATGAPVIVKTRAWWCCTLHGLRAFADLPSSTFRSKGGEVFYDLPLDGHVESDSFSAQSVSTLAKDGLIHIRVVRASAQSLTVRKPNWAEAAVVSLNGRVVSGLRVDRVKTGDLIAVKYSMQRREEKVDSVVASSRVIISYGPWLLGASSDDNAGYFGEHIPQNLLIPGTFAKGKENATSPFAVPVASTSSGYISAEFVDQPGTAHLRAVAEQTGMLPTMWETTFLFSDNKS